MTQDNAETRHKVPILSLATGLMGYGMQVLSTEQYVLGGLLCAASIGMMGLYEIYQVKELPEPVTEDLIVNMIDDVASELTNEDETTGESTEDSEQQLQEQLQDINDEMTDK